MNPFTRAKFISLGYNEEVGFSINIETRNGTTVHLICGTAEVAAKLMLANGVTHFDFLDSVVNNSDVFGAFSRGAKHSGFSF